MGFDYSKLLGRIKEKGMTQKSLSEAIGIGINSLNFKLANKAFFKQQEIRRICEILEIEDGEVGLYFFTQKVQKN